MLILFDQATPVPLRPFLKGHTIKTAWQQGWDRLKNGDLLTAAEEAGFDLRRRLAIVVLGNQQWPQLREHVQLVMDVVNAATPGSYTEVNIPR
jgi:hypothetical protein